MKLEKKKELAAKTFGVGKSRIVFNVERLPEIKEAITRQDIRDLLTNKAITIKQIKGRRKVEGRKTRRRGGSIRKKVKKTKRQYIILTRKLRRHLSGLKKKKLVSPENYSKLRREIRASNFKSKSHMKERITHLTK